MAPAHLHGGLNMMFQLATTLGVFTAKIINYGTEKIKPWGWRLSLGLAAVPALLMTVGGFLLPETPNSLIEQGLKVEGRIILKKIRGTRDVDAEFQDMIEASELANSIKHPFRNILEPRNRPQLVMAMLFMPMFQILTGINSILFYTPVLFQSMGFGGHASLYSSVLTGVVLALSTLVSIATVDKWGRQALLIGGWIQMIICQIIVAIILGLKFGNGQELSKDYSILVVFAYLLQPSDGHGDRSGFPFSALCFQIRDLPLLRRMDNYHDHLCVIFLPKTKGFPIEEMVLLRRKHWFWKKIMPPILVTDAKDSGKSSVVVA
ncbi:hypothetical protein MRB53_013707 [Persea americana]|uniref:Uncharacterized protein n=1 Tax=Persea americana TaxID=3435 RepID=A0ACC2K8U8_PERAE|nr:hypothetical protein MRB53_013707 [Persea americana]